MAQLIGMRQMSDPDLILMSEEERKGRYEMLAKAYREAGLMPPELDAWKKLAPQIMEAKGKDIRGPAEQMAALAKRVNGHEILSKRGRVLSATNENELRGVQAMLDDGEKLIDEIGEKAQEMLGEVKAKLDLVLKQVDSSSEDEISEAVEGDPGDDE
jgi:hypothetical protein